MAVQQSKLKKLRGSGSGFLGWVERKLGLTSSGLVLIVLGIIGYVLAKWVGSRAVYMLVYGAFIVLIVAYVLGRKKLALEADRSDLPTRVREGQPVEVELVITARRRVSTVVMEEVLHHQLGTTVRVPIATLPPGQAVQHAYTFLPRLRGVYKVGPLLAVHSDPFGLTRRRQLILDTTPLIVHPQTERVEDKITARAWEEPPRRPPNSKPWHSGFEFYGMREYQLGDDPRRLVWRAIARKLSGDPLLDSRRGIYLVRESEQGITDHVRIIIDTDQEYHSPGEVSDTFESGVRAASSIARHHLKEGMNVSTYINSGPLRENLRGQARAAIRMLDDMAQLNREKIPLTEIMKRLVRSPRRDIHHVIITPHIEPAVASQLGNLLQKAVPIVIVKLVWEDSDPESLHRATTLGCNVVQLPPRVALARVFRAEVGRVFHRS